MGNANAPSTASSSGSSSGGYGSGAPEKRSKELFELQVLSDTHLEFDGVVDVVPSAPYLALLGDIGLCCDERFDQLHAFILKVCSMFRAVFFVYGNHEGYGTTIEDVTKKLRQLQSSIANFVFLDCDSCDVPGTDVRILGCSLWSDIK
ncbi:hypothetical protein Pelo_1782 [Pelomyxa schiedti]|nr:hypothetical protein Pelo_1782 [Pelomyxa schiedti]